ncbi:MAG: pseudouridine synthase [Luminiphilus sp.]|nr:pseudouridine synthase [Luminiphilus sp.]
MSQVILLNKPFHVLSQFTDREQPGDPRATLADFLDAPSFRPAGRLDYDSEGLLVLTRDGKAQQRIAHPQHQQWKTYWVQVEGDIDDGACAGLCSGVELKDGMTRPAKADLIPPPDIWIRDPPIRQRKTVNDSWLSLSITEGRNRQVKRMTAAVGYPTLQLIRVSVGSFQLGTLQPGEHRYETLT